MKSLRWSFAVYLPICGLVAFAGVFFIGVATNYVQNWYIDQYGIPEMGDYRLIIMQEGSGKPVIGYEYEGAIFLNERFKRIYEAIGAAQFVLIPLWVTGSLWATGSIFYRRNLQEPISLLMEAAQSISDNRLDFEISYYKDNEMGALCGAVNDMRVALVENNRELWRSLEQRKRLNAAFSHDMRTPLTVLKGYTEFLERYAGGEKISQEKMGEILKRMSDQIVRLEHYTQKMNAVQKLEDVVPKYREFPAEELADQLRGSGALVCGEKQFTFAADLEPGQKLVGDPELVMQVYENLVSNAARYARRQVWATLAVQECGISLEVRDDGPGFTWEGMKNATVPFFREEEKGEHFGLGLYICRILCEKQGGTLTVGNWEQGGMVTGFFSQSR